MTGTNRNIVLKELWIFAINADDIIKRQKSEKKGQINQYCPIENWIFGIFIKLLYQLVKFHINCINWYFVVHKDWLIL